MIKIAMVLHALLLPLCMSMIGYCVGDLKSSSEWQTKIHNAAATGDEITIDGLRYRFVVVGKEE
jgi:hypothetical protein